MNCLMNLMDGVTNMEKKHRMVDYVFRPNQSQLIKINIELKSSILNIIKFNYNL